MKSATILALALGLIITPFLVSPQAFHPAQAQAQESGYEETADLYSREELAQMLAPIALYPDALLAQILMAATYPIEVIEADRWLKKNPGLQGDTLDTALLDTEWDASVKAICHFPSVLALMSERISETTALGNVFLAQEEAVMNMVQELRAAAHAQGNLTTSSQQKIIVEKETIIIEAANPRVIYVPYYDPLQVYGPWWYPAFPPYYWGPARVSLRSGIAYRPAIHFSFIFGTWSYFDWHRHTIYLNAHRRPGFVRQEHWITTPSPWYHNPRHRRGVAYHNKSTARKYGQSPTHPHVYRHDTRGFPSPRVQERQRPDQPRFDHFRQQQQRLEQEKKTRQQQAVLDRLEQQRLERSRLENSRRQQQQLELQKKALQQKNVRDTLKLQGAAPARIEPEKKLPSPLPGNIFELLDNGRQERQSSERGQNSRRFRDGPAIPEKIIPHSDEQPSPAYRGRNRE